MQVTDFRMAGFLVARGQKILRTEMNSSLEVSFIFQGEKEILELLSAYPGSPEQVYDSACKTMYGLVKLTQRRLKEPYRG